MISVFRRHSIGPARPQGVWRPSQAPSQTEQQDADTQQYFFRENSNGTIWEGAPESAQELMSFHLPRRSMAFSPPEKQPPLLDQDEWVGYGGGHSVMVQISEREIDAHERNMEAFFDEVDEEDAQVQGGVDGRGGTCRAERLFERLRQKDARERRGGHMSLSRSISRRVTDTVSRLPSLRRRRTAALGSERSSTPGSIELRKSDSSSDGSTYAPHVALEDVSEGREIRLRMIAAGERRSILDVK